MIIVKAGTDVLVKKEGSLDMEVIKDRMREIVQLTREGISIIFVVSGAAAKGRKALGVQKREDESIVEKMVLCSIGMPRVVRACEEVLSSITGKEQWVTAQVLVTQKDIRASAHAHTDANNPTIKDSFRAMWDRGGVIPIVNANDPVNSEELKNSDNDQLAESLTTLMHAERLVILSKSGLLRNIHDGRTTIRRINPLYEDCRCYIQQSHREANGTGNWKSKYDVAERLALQGIDVSVGNGKSVDAIQKLIQEKIGTLFSIRPHMPSARNRR